MSSFTYTHTNPSPSNRGPQIDSWVSDNPSFAEQVKCFKKHLAYDDWAQQKMEEEFELHEHDYNMRVVRPKWNAIRERNVKEYESEVAQFADPISWNRMVHMSWPGED